MKISNKDSLQKKRGYQGMEEAKSEICIYFCGNEPVNSSGYQKIFQKNIPRMKISRNDLDKILEAPSEQNEINFRLLLSKLAGIIEYEFDEITALEFLESRIGFTVHKFVFISYSLLCKTEIPEKDRRTFVEKCEKEIFKSSDLILSIRGLFEAVFPSKDEDIFSDLVDQAFYSDYVGSDKSLVWFEQFFRYIIQEYRKPTYKVSAEDTAVYHSPFFTIVQSSGFGKTRLVKEVALSRLNIVYCCLRPSSSSGFPDANSDVITFIDKNYTKSVALQAFISCTFIEANKLACSYLDSFQVKDDEIALGKAISEQFSGNVLCEAFWKNVLKILEDESAFGRIIDEFISLQKCFSLAAYDNRSQGMLSKRKYKANVVSELLIVFDESRSLLLEGNDPLDKLDTPFRALRSAHRSLQSKNCFLVLIDTLSSVANFAPPTILEPSYRHKTPMKGSSGNVVPFNALLPPFYEILTSDIFHSENDLADVEKLGPRYSRGRPLWKIYFSEEKFFELGISYAICKLLCRKTPSAYEEPELIAILSLRFGIIGISDMRLGNVLVSSHMATLVYLNNDRTKMSVRYPAEPALMEAACATLHSPSETLNQPSYEPEQLAKIIEFFTSNWVSGIINVGELGEIIGRMILALTYDYVKLESEEMENLPFLTSISVENFLSVLIPNSTRKLYEDVSGNTMINLDPDLMKGRISLIGFDFVAELDKDNLQKSLREAFHLGIGIMLPVNFPGLDLLIPVYLKDSNEMTFIGVQFKLHGEFGKQSRSEAFHKMDPAFAFQYRAKDPKNPSEHVIMKDFRPTQPYACILFELGPNGQPFSKRSHPSEIPENMFYVPQIEIFGIMKDAAIYDAFQLARNFKMDCDRSAARLFSLKSLCPFTYINSTPEAREAENQPNIQQVRKHVLPFKRPKSSKRTKCSMETVNDD